MVDTSSIVIEGYEIFSATAGGSIDNQKVSIFGTSKDVDEVQRRISDMALSKC